MYVPKTEPIGIDAGQWAITSSTDQKTQIETVGSAHSFVATFIAGNNENYAAMVHMQQRNRMDSIQAIFDAFKNKSIPVETIKVVCFYERATDFWANQIAEKILAAGIKEENIEKRMVFSNDYYSRIVVDACDREIEVSKENIMANNDFGDIFNVKLDGINIEQDCNKNMKMQSNVIPIKQVFDDSKLMFYQEKNEIPKQIHKSEDISSSEQSIEDLRRNNPKLFSCCIGK